ncbi:PAS domain-containing protein [Marinilabilia salmonicolor]|uniref:histidine kinase n=1 Tax=Marinilabilia salmonicolor TaxID=989 RepID=A0A368UWS7_9BACT|nr:PAS domain-containing protein [Marinilabilia salmonicolor]RCW31341.1 PAS domain S-box-containing protein [Marinilabilia salmonicolor]
MHNVKGFPPTALETLGILTAFTASVVVLTVETEGDITYIHAGAGNAPEEKSLLEKAVNKTAGFGHGISGWFELNDPLLVRPYKSGRFINLTSKSLSGNNRLCLFTNNPEGWSKQQLLLMDQTRKSIEQQFENYFFEPNTIDQTDNDRFRLLFDYSPVGVFFYTTSLKISAFNDRFVSVLGAPASRLLNLDLNTISDRSILPAILRPLSGGEGDYEGTYTSLLSGKRINVTLKTAPILNNSGEITGVIGVVTDNTDKINTLNELKESKNRLKVLINATPDIICFKNAEGQWMEANESIQELYRLKGKDFLFKSEEHLKKLVPELSEVFRQCSNSDQMAWERKEPIVVEEIVPLPNGDERRIDVIKTPVFYADGTKKGIVILGRDITARKKAEEMLRESEERFRIVATHANDIIFEWNPASDKISWFGNSGYIGSAQTPPRTFHEFVKLIHPDDRKRVEHFWTHRFPLKEEWNDEFKVQLRNGNTKHYRASGIMIFKEGNPEKVIGTFTNITQEKELIFSLKEAVEEAQNNQARITGLLAVIPDLIFVFNRDGVIKDYHADSGENLYVAPEVFLDKKIDEFMPEEIARLTHEKIASVISHKGIETYEYEITEDGKTGIYESRMVFVDENRIMTIVRDVTHARQVEKDLIAAKEQAEKSDHLKSAFLANMSHEIRTPMNGILGFSELLRNEYLDPEERRKSIDVIVKSGQQLLAIINDVLQVSQLETGQVSLMPDKVNLNKLVTDLARFFEIEATDKAVELITQIPERQITATVDGGKITQIFNNLISNAFKFTSPGGHIAFGFEEDGNEIRFFVHDDGIGIAEKHHKIIFERFGQILKIGAKNKGGTGLGLSISKSLVELMGGQIWVESEAGHGASFFFSLSRSMEV